MMMATTIAATTANIMTSERAYKAALLRSSSLNVRGPVRSIYIMTTAMAPKSSEPMRVVCM